MTDALLLLQAMIKYSFYKLLFFMFSVLINKISKMYLALI